MRWIATALLAAFICLPCFGELSVSGLVNDSADAVKVRVGTSVGEGWEVGGTASIDITEPDDLWSAGAYCKMIVNPGASVPVADWLGSQIGALLNLPETLEGQTYVVGEVVYLDNTSSIEDGQGELAAAIGPGVQIGPVVGELIYRVISGGETAGPPSISSGVVLWAGLRLEF